MVFIVSNSNLLPSINQSALVNGIKSAFGAANFPSLYDEVPGTEHRLIYEVVLDANANFGKLYLEVEINASLQVRQRLHTGWDPIANVGVNSGTYTDPVQFNPDVEITFRGFEKSDEARIIGIRQTNLIQYLGYISPVVKPSWWNTNSSLYAFVPSDPSFLTLYGPAASNSPYGNAVYVTSLGRPQMASSNPISGKRDIVTGLLIYTAANQGAAGRSSDDLVMVAASGLGTYDLIQVTPGAEEYMILSPLAGGLALRVV